jgi:RNA polymerase sigma-70 factor (ECF subfamily)
VTVKGLTLRLVRGSRVRLSGQPSSAPSSAASDDLADLVRRCRAGDDDRAVRTLLIALGPPMLQVIRRVLGARHPDVEDALQEATVALVRALPGFRGDCSTRTFGRRIAACAAIDVRRRDNRAPARVGLEADADAEAHVGVRKGGAGQLGVEVEDPRAADWALAARRRELVRRLLDELPEPQAEALVLHCAAGLTVDELARSSGVPVETARSRLRLAKAALRLRVASDPAAIDLLEEAP